MAKLSKWIVVDMDDGVVATFPTKCEARSWCREQHEDGRKHAGWRRMHTGLYEYESPLQAMHGSTWYVGMREPLEAAEWNDAIKAYEEGREYNDDQSNRYWNHLAAPTRG